MVYIHTYIHVHIYMPLYVIFKVLFDHVCHHSFSTKKEIRKTNILSKKFYSLITVIFIVNIQNIQYIYR